MFARSFAVSLLALSAPAAWAAQWTIGVGVSENTGGAGIGFDPSRVTPAIGDTIVFEWSRAASPHNIAQINPLAPCAAAQGGYSFQPGAEQTIPVNSTDPIYFTSLTGTECEQGMFFCANCPADGAGSISALQQNAATNPLATIPITSTTSSTTASSTSSATASASESTHKDGSASALSITAVKYLTAAVAAAMFA